MKTIKTRYGVIIETFGQPTEAITAELIEKIYAPININKIKIFDTVATLEGLLDNIITHYFYGEQTSSNKEHRDKFKGLVLSSDWCTFATKRKLIIHIINEQSLLKGQEKDDFNNLLRKSMSYRNIFAHGVMSTDGRIIKIKYFEGEQRIVELNDDFFTEVESVLNKCYYLLWEIAINFGSIKIRKE